MKIKKIKLSDIIPYKQNPFVHTTEELNRVKTSIENNTYIFPIVLGKNNIIIAGHLRHIALLELHDSSFEIDVIDASHLTEEQERKLRILDNNKPDIDFSLMELELSSMYTNNDLEKALLETGLDISDYLDSLEPSNIEKQFDDFITPKTPEPPPPKEYTNTKNSLEITRRREEAEIRFTLAIQQYELYSSLKRDILKANDVNNIGDLFMLYFLNDAKKFGISYDKNNS